jgi:hypothetical protein
MTRDETLAARVLQEGRALAARLVAETIRVRTLPDLERHRPVDLSPP